MRNVTPLARLATVALFILGTLFHGRVASTLAAQQPEHFDLLVRGGRVLDGTGNPWFRADIGVR